MLTKIREKFTGGLAIAVLALIGIPFLFFGVNSSIIGQPFAAKVDGSEISLTQFENAYRDQLERNPTWAQLPEEFRLQIREGVLNSLVRERLIQMHLIDAGYQISDATLTRSIQRVPDFQVDGKFDLETYRSLLLQNGLDATQFELSQRRALREDQLRRAIGATALVTPAEYRRYLNLVAEQRLVSLATFDIDGVAADVEVTDEMMPGVVCLPHGFGHDKEGARLSVASQHAGVCSNILAPGSLVDVPSGNAVVNGIPVHIAPG